MVKLNKISYDMVICMYKKKLIQKNDVLNVGKCSILFSGKLLVLSIKSIKKHILLQVKPLLPLLHNYCSLNSTASMICHVVLSFNISEKFLDGGGGVWFLTPFQQYFRYIVVVSFISGGNRSTGRKP